jgi:hypothetical protein
VTTAAEYRQFVTECVNNAAGAAKPNDKTTWLEMARHWERLAREVENDLQARWGRPLAITDEAIE